MPLHFAVFGRQPEIGLAELRAVLPTANITPCGQGAIVDDPSWDGEKLMDLLGGTVKLGDVMFDGKADAITVESLADVIEQHPRAERIIFGYSVFDEHAGNRKRLELLPLKLKRELKARGHSSRWVTGDESTSPSPAAVAKMKLTTEGYDLVILCGAKRGTIGLTTHVQDADAWSLRDYGRPMRDDKSGMLPPKLARIMVNLACAKYGTIILDPFCGSGTIPMEALLATSFANDVARHNLKIIASDNAPKCIADTNANLDWLVERNVISATDRTRVETILCDARKIDTCVHQPIDAVVTEGYLGPPLSGREPRTTLEKNAKEISSLWHETLRTLRPMLSKNARIVGIWPEFGEGRDRVAVDLSNEVSALGYRLVGEPLRYQRPGQRLARRIFVLIAA